jgi:hypothetical protein
MLPEPPSIPRGDGERSRSFPTVSTVLPSGAVAEMVYRPEVGETGFVLWQDSGWTAAEWIDLPDGRRLVPYSPDNNLLVHKVVLFPTEPEEYGSEAELVAEIRAFIHRFVDVSPTFEEIGSYYVLFSWLYDSFNELPYLRVRGDYGSGKSRFLLTVGSLCYKPIFASGASTVSPIFRIIDAFRGTLVIDESDFAQSDEKSEIVKILNNGNARGFPVLRSEVNHRKEFDPKAYAVFGPKLIATRGFFQDRALESRCLTEELGLSRLREDIPLNLPAAHADEALRLRNKLLLFRFRNLGKPRALDAAADRGIEPRLSQIFAPLRSVIEDPQTQESLQELARRYHRELVAERGLDLEAQVLETIQGLSLAGKSLSVKEITAAFIERHGADYGGKVTPRWIGSILRKRLRLRPQKRHGVFVLPETERASLERLYEKYGLDQEIPVATEEEVALTSPF